MSKNEIEMLTWVCVNCKDKFESIAKDPNDPLANYCPDCIGKFYQLKIDGSYEKRDKPFKADLSYRDKPEVVSHRGKYKNLNLEDK